MRPPFLSKFLNMTKPDANASGFVMKEREMKINMKKYIKAQLSCAICCTFTLLNNFVQNLNATYIICKIH